jgi:acetoin utilization deacetylase AcuC-like enzyme
MICLYNTIHVSHNPPFEVFNGDHDTAMEIPDRAVNIYQALKQEQFPFVEDCNNVPRALLETVHRRDYVRFLETTCKDLGDKEYLYPSVWSYVPTIPSAARDSRLSQLGRYVFDTYTPLLHDTYRVALGSASLAYTAATLLHRSQNETYYALCRPPGHHAEHAMAGGYCYFNNAAVAAQYLSRYGKVATLDVDFHHGNGTQHIFYERDDVCTVSIHADPRWKFPYYSGSSGELGQSKGKGFNHNFPLQKGTTDKQYAAVLQRALAIIREFEPQYLVVSYGADTHVSDPIGGFRLSTGYFTQMGRLIRSLSVPTMIVQEGGYNNEHLGKNVTAFLKGFV